MIIVLSIEKDYLKFINLTENLHNQTEINRTFWSNHPSLTTSPKENLRIKTKKNKNVKISLVFTICWNFYRKTTKTTSFTFLQGVYLGITHLVRTQPFSKKLHFSPRDAYVHVRKGVRNISFSKNLACVLNAWSLGFLGRKILLKVWFFKVQW